MRKIVSFGEVMLRLSPPGHMRIRQAHSFDVLFGGAEANVCAALSQFGFSSAFVTKLPDNALGDACYQAMQGLGIDVSGIKRGGERIGIYFYEKGTSVRPSKVLYDRKASAVATADTCEFDWECLFKGADAFYFTGITPALSDNLAKITLDACRVARRMGLFIACDMNYRPALWSKERAAETMPGLVFFVDLLMAGFEDAVLLGLNTDSPEAAVKALSTRFGIRRVASTIRQSRSASDNILTGILYDSKNDTIYKSRDYELQIVDRVGGGDAFSAGMIYSLLSDLPAQDVLDFATAASAFAHTVEGDFPYFSHDEVFSLVSDTSGRIRR